jgi:hypothetical protein
MKEVGGYPAFGDLNDQTRITDVAVDGKKLTDKTLSQIKALLTDAESEAFFSVHFEGLNFTDDRLAQVKDLLVDFHGVFLTETSISDEGLKHLAGIKDLRCLAIPSISPQNGGFTKKPGNVNGTGLAYLAHHENLEHLDLRNTRVNDAAIKHIRKLAQLTFLNLDRTKITDEGFEELQRSLNKTAFVPPWGFRGM